MVEPYIISLIHCHPVEYKRLEIVKEANDSTVSCGSVILYQGTNSILFLTCLWSSTSRGEYTLFRIYQHAAELKWDSDNSSLTKTFKEISYIWYLHPEVKWRMLSVILNSSSIKLKSMLQIKKSWTKKQDFFEDKIFLIGLFSKFSISSSVTLSSQLRGHHRKAAQRRRGRMRPRGHMRPRGLHLSAAHTRLRGRHSWRPGGGGAGGVVTSPSARKAKRRARGEISGHSDLQCPLVRKLTFFAEWKDM